MKIMNFSYCLYITKIPDVSRLLNLEELTLDNCLNLVEVHRSVGLLDKLVVLSLDSCFHLTMFPRSFKLRSLKRLVLAGCLMLKNFPEIFEFTMEVLEYIDLQNTGIVELPSSIGYLIRVKQMLLDNCKYLTNLPHTIHKLEYLKELSLYQCIGIKKLPSSIGYLGRIKTLNLQGCINLMNLPYSIYQLQHLEILNLIECEQLQEILRLPPNAVEVHAQGCVSLAIFLEEPRSQLLNTWDPSEPVGVRMASSALRSSSLGKNVVTESDFLIERDCPRNLEVLDLSHSVIVSLPAWLNEFVGLKRLYLVGCNELREILRLPPNVVEVQALGCVSLVIFLEEPRRFQLLNTWDPPGPVGFRTASSTLRSSSLGDNVVTESDFLIEHDCPSSLKVLDLSRSAIVSLPTWLNRFVRLEELYLSYCKKLEEIPELPPNIKKVFADGCLSLERFQYNNINDLPMLEFIDFSNCHRLGENMGDDLQIRLLSEVHIYIHIYIPVGVCLYL
jgi:Leucine-rich repeat (LRR) protein